MIDRTDNIHVRALELIGRHLGMFVDRVTTDECSTETIMHHSKVRLRRLEMVEEVLVSTRPEWVMKPRQSILYRGAVLVTFCVYEK